MEANFEFFVQNNIMKPRTSAPNRAHPWKKMLRTTSFGPFGADIGLNEKFGLEIGFYGVNTIWVSISRFIGVLITKLATIYESNMVFLSILTKLLV